MNLHDTIPGVAGRLRAGLNGDPDQRAATELLIAAVNGVWLAKLGGWAEYVCPTEDARRPGGLWIDWQQLRGDLAADDRAWAAFSDWADSYPGRQASEDTYEHTRDQMVPRRPWHGASSSELVVLRIAVELAPGGLFGDGIARLDEANTAAVVTAVNTLVEGRYIEPDPAERARRADLLERCVDLAAELGAGLVSIWAGAAPGELVADGRAGPAAGAEPIWARLVDGVLAGLFSQLEDYFAAICGESEEVAHVSITSGSPIKPFG